jgi:hypothetical protein
VCLLDHFPSKMVAYMDYGDPIHDRDIDSLARRIVRYYSGGTAVPMVYAVSDAVTLKPLFVFLNKAKDLDSLE